MAEGQKKGRLIDPELRRIRFLQFVNDKLAGLTDKEIGAKHNLTSRTVERTLSWGKRAGIIADAEDALLKDLFPAAQKVLMDALTTDKDVTVAMKIYDKVVKGRDAKVGTNSAVDEDELAKFMAERRKRQEQIEATIEGELAGPSVAGLLAGEQPGDAGNGESGGQSPARAALSPNLRSEERRSEPPAPDAATALEAPVEAGTDLPLDPR